MEWIGLWGLVVNAAWSCCAGRMVPLNLRLQVFANDVTMELFPGSDGHVFFRNVIADKWWKMSFSAFTSAWGRVLSGIIGGLMMNANERRAGAIPHFVCGCVVELSVVRNLLL